MWYTVFTPGFAGITSAILSLCALQLFVYYVWRGPYRVIYIHAFYLLIGGVCFGMMKGMIADEFVPAIPWMILTIVEILLCVVAIVLWFDGPRCYCWDLLVAFLVIVGKIFLFVVFWVNKGGPKEEEGGESR